MKRGYDMKKRLVKIRIAVCVCAAFGWWGFLYPELTLTPDTCRVCGEPMQKKSLPAQDLYRELLEADTGEIRFRSRLLTEWNEFMEAINDSGQQ